MKIKLLLFAALIIFNACSGNEDKQNNFQPDVIKDDLGKKFEFENPPKTIVTLAPNLTEMIYKLDLGDKLIGNTTYCNFPPASKEVKKVGDLISVDFEVISELEPDIIFMTVEGNKKNNYEKLLDLGYRVFVSDPRTFEGIQESFMDIGEIFDKRELALKYITKWDSVVADIWNKSRELPEKSAMFLVQLQPIMLAGKNTFIHEYLKTCNLKNIAAESEQNYPKYSREEILLKDPDFIITAESNKQESFADIYPEWAALRAVKEDNIIYVDSDLFFRPGPRFVDALKDLYSHLHPK
jgi:iron complex transport system substrate-binding protein